MKNLKFSHEGKNYVVKGEWDNNVFTAQAYAGKKTVSAPFTIAKDSVDGTVADDEALENAVLEAAKNDVISGEADEQE